MLKTLIPVLAVALGACGPAPDADPALYRPLPSCLSNQTLAGRLKGDVLECAHTPCSVEKDPAANDREAWVYCATQMCEPSCWWSTRVYFEGERVTYLRVRTP